MIYYNISNRAKELINNILNKGFTYYIINIMQEGIKEQFKGWEKEVIDEIYSKLFIENNEIKK